MTETTAVVNTPDPYHTVEGSMTRTVRIIGLSIAGTVLLAIVLGAWRGATSPLPGKSAIVDGLMIAEVVFGSALILLGSVVEGFGQRFGR